MADESVAERWLAVPGYEGSYEVSDQGRVRSLDRVVHTSDGKVRLFPGVTLKTDVQRGGYVYAKLPRAHARRVHRLVLLAFVGPAPRGTQCRHLNGRPADNRLANLAWGTWRENHADQRRHGTELRGERHGRARLTKSQVLDIRARSAKGESGYSLAAEYGVSAGAIGHVIARTSWTHLP